MIESQDLARQLPHIVQKLKFSTNAIESSVELLRELHAVPAGASESIGRIQESLKLIRSTVRELLDAYMTSFSSTAVLMDARLVSIVDQAVMRVLNSFKGRGQRLIVQVPESISVEASSSLLVEGIAELLANASRNAPHRSTVEVIGAAADGWATVEVVNEGRAVPLEVQAELLLPPEPLEAGRERPRFVPGASGLRTVKRIAEHHLGALDHRVEEGSRNVMTLRLPLSAESAVLDERKSA